MASIKFSSTQAHERFVECKRETEQKGDKTLMQCIGSLMTWKRDIVIGCDFDKQSFTFHEVLTEEEQAQGLHAIFGGIIYHGAHDGFGSGTGPTHSVTLDKAEGYRIHT